MEIRIIVAVTRNRAIGRRGDLLFHISEDLKRFKRLTMGAPIIMGRKTFESFPKGPLPGRRNIVITRNPDYAREGIETAGSLEEALKLVEGSDKAFIIGGSQIYSQALPLATHLDLTEIDAEVTDADAFFPEIDRNEWTEVASESTEAPTVPPVRFVTLCR